MEQNDLIKVIQAFQELWILKFSDEIMDKFKPVRVSEPYRSEQINELATALAKAQGEFPNIDHNRDNAFFKSSYADLHAIMCVVRPILSKNGLAISQPIHTGENNEVTLHTQLLHTTGQWMETRNRIIPEKGDVQSYGRAITYHKRYSVMALLGITAGDDPTDDDAEGLMEKHRALEPTVQKYDPKKQSSTTITPEQLEELQMELDGYPDLAEKLMHAIKIEQLCDMPKSMYLDAINKIRQRKVQYASAKK